jgi:oxygen-dependent protoporphyrinogen oxidase
MKRIAILGGGISGLTAAYELELARKAGADIDWQLYEASERLGGIVETTEHEGFVLEGGPDGWVSEKPRARELAVALGLESELIYSNDATRKTYIVIDGKLQAIPDGMRMMVPTDLAALEGSPLLSAEAKKAYAAEIARADELKAAAPDEDESVANFVRRHFGEEVLRTLAAPLLSGVFGGDVHKLSVRAVMPQFVAMEREYGSLIVALQAKDKQRGSKVQSPIFTSLRRGVGSLVDALVARLPTERIHLNSPVFSIKRESTAWCVRYNTPSQRATPGKSKKHFQHVVLAASLDTARGLIEARHAEAAALLPLAANSAVLAAFTWPVELAKTFVVPQGFGFLVPACSTAVAQECGDLSTALRSGRDDSGGGYEAPSLLACTFVDQKFPERAPAGGRILRAFFGGDAAAQLETATDAQVADAALAQLRKLLGPLPEPAHTEVRRWPRSLPQYEVGHLERMAQLEALVALAPGLHLLGNSYHGVGLPDLVRDARAVARKIVSGLVQ